MLQRYVFQCCEEKSLHTNCVWSLVFFAIITEIETSCSFNKCYKQKTVFVQGNIAKRSTVWNALNISHKISKHYAPHLYNLSYGQLLHILCFAVIIWQHLLYQTRKRYYLCIYLRLLFKRCCHMRLEKIISPFEQKICSISITFFIKTNTDCSECALQPCSRMRFCPIIFWNRRSVTVIIALLETSQPRNYCGVLVESSGFIAHTSQYSHFMIRFTWSFFWYYMKTLLNKFQFLYKKGKSYIFWE